MPWPAYRCTTKMRHGIARGALGRVTQEHIRFGVIFAFIRRLAVVGCHRGARLQCVLDLSRWSSEKCRGTFFGGHWRGSERTNQRIHFSDACLKWTRPRRATKTSFDESHSILSTLLMSDISYCRPWPDYGGLGAFPSPVWALQQHMPRINPAQSDHRSATRRRHGYAVNHRTRMLVKFEHVQFSRADVQKPFSQK